MAKSSSSATLSETKIRPLHDKIIVRRDEAEDRTAAGIILPEKAKDTPKTGVVVAVGTGNLNTETGKLISLPVQKGRRDLFSSYAGSGSKLGDFGNDKVLVMAEDEVLAIID